MRTIIALMFLALLAGCNGSSDDDTAFATTAQIPPNEATAVAAMRAQITALQAQVSKFNELQLIGKTTAVTVVSRNLSPDSYRAMGELPQVATSSFGPCADMGVLQGRGGSDTTDPLLSQFEIFKTCTGSTYSISTSTGLLDMPPYLAWDGPGCTGNAYLEMDVPQNTMNTDAVKNGIAFLSPLPNDTRVFYVNSTTNPPVMVFIQSAINSRPGSAGCQTDQESRLVTIATANSTQSNGVPNSLVPGTWTTVAP